MKINYRQGIVTSQLNSNGVPTFLADNISPGYVSLYANANSVIFTAAHGDYNYLYEEANTIEKAWGPFEAPLRPKYWLYWDIDLTSGIRTFGYTSLEPVVSSTKPTFADKGLLWFNLADRKMYEYDGYGWIEKIRVFAGTYESNTLVPYSFESQVGLNETIYAGYILFDDNDFPLIRSNNRTFLTTESQFYTTKSIIGAVKFDTVLFYAGAVENIPQYSVVSYYDDNRISLASAGDPQKKAAVGLIRNEVYRTEVAAVVANGYVTNVDWNWVEPPATPVYLGTYGTLQTIPPQIGFIQKIGTIVSRDTILVDIDPQILYHDGIEKSTYSPLSVDLISGKLYTNEIFDPNTLPPDVGTNAGTGPGVVPAPEENIDTKVLGVSCVQKIEKMKWTIEHNLSSANIFVQVYDDKGDYVIPNTVRIIDANTIEIQFTAPIAGTAQLIVMQDPIIINIPDLNVPTFEADFAVLSDTWVIEHDIGHLPIVRVYGVDGFQIIPYSIEHPTVNKTIITFARPRAGIVRLL